LSNYTSVFWHVTLGSVLTANRVLGEPAICIFSG